MKNKMTKNTIKIVCFKNVHYICFQKRMPLQMKETN